MASTQGISFLHQFDLGNRDVVNLGSNILSVSSTATGDFDKGNMTTESVRHVWRSTNVITEQEIIIQAERVSQIDTFAILGHNFTPQVIVRVEANFSNNFLSPPFSQVIPFARDNMVLAQDFGSDFEFYRVTILDPGNPCQFVEVGRIVGGQAFTFTNNEDVTDDVIQGNEDFADTMRSEGFFRFSNERVKARDLSLVFRKLFTTTGEDINFIGLKNMLENVGKTRPFLTIVDRQNINFITIWGQLKSLPNFSFTVNKFVSLRLSIEEVF